MKTTRVLSVLLTLTILSGSVPYSYTYCMLMKKTLDSVMLLRCNAHRGISHSSRTASPSLNSARRMMLFVSKSTIDSYEHRGDRANAQAFTLLILSNAASIQPIGPSLSYRFEADHTSPHIVTESLNLRI